MTTMETPNGLKYAVIHLKEGDLITLYPPDEAPRESVREACRWLHANYKVVRGGINTIWHYFRNRTLNPVQ